jgi:hypothetical protein
LFDPVVVERAESEIDRFIERRANGRELANREEALWKESERKHRERQRRRNLALWYDFFLSMADSHAQLATSYEERALQLLEEGGGGA